MNIEINLTDNSGEVLKELENSIERALERIGMKAETYAAARTPVDTGRLRSSMTHTVQQQGNSVVIGTNVEYGIWHEIGTGIYASEPGGRQTPWKYVDSNGETHWTRGIKPQHMLKRAIEEHVDEYRDVIKEELQK